MIVEYDTIIKEISKKFNKKDKIIQIMFNECKKLDFNIQESKQIINDFLSHKF